MAGAISVTATDAAAPPCDPDFSEATVLWPVTEAEKSMTVRRNGNGRRRVVALVGGVALAVGGTVLTAPTAEAAGVLTLIGNNSDNVITVGREAGGRIVVTGAAVTGTPTVANTELIQVFGQGGNDTLTLSESGGALPRANLFGGSGADTLTGGSGADLLFGQAGNDALLGKLGADVLFGGDDSDTLTGGDADDQLFGEAGDDRMVWNNGDDTDLDEGGEGVDRVQVIGHTGSEVFTVRSVGVRVRLDRVGASSFSVDIGTSELLSLSTGAGQDSVDASGLTDPALRLEVSTGPENDAVTGSTGADLIDTGDGTDAVNGQGGDDRVFLGNGDDLVGWSPGDGNDVVEGDAGVDRLDFLGSSADERFQLAADGHSVRLTRSVAAVTMELDELEVIRLRASGGVDAIAIGDLSGTDVTDVETRLSVTETGAVDGLRDTVEVTGTAGDDTARVAGTVGFQQVTGTVPRVMVVGADRAPIDRIAISAGDGNDLVDASSLAAPAGIVIIGGSGDDALIGSEGDDVIFGGDGDDALIGRSGTDTLNGGLGDDLLIGGEIVTDGLIPTKAWLAGHVRTVDGDAVIDLGRTRLVVPGISAEALQEL